MVQIRPHCAKHWGPLPEELLGYGPTPVTWSYLVAQWAGYRPGASHTVWRTGKGCLVVLPVWVGSPSDWILCPRLHRKSVSDPEVEARSPVWHPHPLTCPFLLLTVMLASSAETSNQGIFHWVLLLMSFFLTNRWKLTARFLSWHKERFCHPKWGRKNITQNKEFSIRNCTIATEKDVEAHYTFSACCNLCFDATGHQKSEDLSLLFYFSSLFFLARRMIALTGAAWL